MVVATDVRFRTDEPTKTPDDFFIMLKNGGRSVAVIDEMYVQALYMVSKKILPDEPNYFGASVQDLVTPPIFPSDTKIVAIHVGDKIVPGPEGRLSNITPEERLNRVKSGDIPFNIYGFVKYRTGIDADPRQRMSGFCYTYVPLPYRGGIGPQFTTCDKPKYTYAR